MRRAFAIAVTALLLATGVLQRAALAGGSSLGTERRGYSAQGFNLDIGLMACPAGVVGISNGGLGVQTPAVFFKVPRAARAVSLRIADRSGTDVMAYVWHGGHPVGSFCGRTAHPFRLRGPGRLEVALFDAVTTTGLSIVTSGTVAARFWSSR